MLCQFGCCWLWMCTCVVREEYIDGVIETVRAHSSEECGKERESGKRRGKKKEGKKGKGGKGFWGIVGVFV